MKIFRHGDLLIIKTGSIPKGLSLKKDTILLEGEATGHMHKLEAGEVYEISESDERYLIGYIKITEKTPLTHPEHEVITLEPGFYKYYRQREYSEIDDVPVTD